jgi:hypothetical protein
MPFRGQCGSTSGRRHRFASCPSLPGQLATFGMKFDWRRPLAPAVLVLGLLLCFIKDPVVGFGIFLVSFALILGFSRGSERN